MNKKILTFTSLSLTLAIACVFLLAKSTQAEQASTIPTSFSFQTNLQYGQTKKPDVNYLQLFLNQDPRTVVSESGPGSLSDLTSYFGQKTKDAVKKFQQLFAADILTPANLTQPTGVFGPLTRAKANILLSQQRTNLAGTGANINSNSTSLTGNNQPNTGVIGASGANTSQNSGSSGSSGGGAAAGIIGGVAGGVAGGVIGSAAGGLTSGGFGLSGSGANGGAASGAGSSGSSGGAGGMTSYFGGNVTNVTYCTCDTPMDLMLDINDVRGGKISLMFKFGQSTLYANYNIWMPGPNVLGSYMQGGGQCQVGTQPECTSEGSPRGTIQQIGTSSI